MYKNSFLKTSQIYHLTTQGLGQKRASGSKRRVLDAASLLDELRTRFGSGLLDAEVREHRSGIQGQVQTRDLHATLSPLALRPFVEALFEYDVVSFHAMTSRGTEETLTVRYHLSLFQRRRGGRVGVLVEVRLPRTTPRLSALSDLLPGAASGEAEVRETFGVTLDEMGTAALEKEEREHPPVARRAAVYEMGLGPLYPGFPGPLRLELDLWGERVLGARLYLPRRSSPLESVPFSRALTWAEGSGDDSPFAHALGFVRAVEDAVSVTVSPRAQYLRALLGELERLRAHLLGLAEACRAVGIGSAFRKLMLLREWPANFFDSPAGILVVGGVSRDLDPDAEEFLRHALRSLRDEAALLKDGLLGYPPLLARMRDVGILSRGEVTAWGATGPVARGSGLRVDLRKSAPYEGYADLEVEPVVPQEWGGIIRGDVYDRFLVRFMELEGSIRLLFELLEKLPRGLLVGEEVPPFLPNFEKEGSSFVEAPQGGLFHGVRLTGSLVSGWDVQHPSYVNAMLLPLALKGCELSDIPLIVGSVVPQLCAFRFAC